MNLELLNVFLGVGIAGMIISIVRIRTATAKINARTEREELRLSAALPLALCD